MGRRTPTSYAGIAILICGLVMIGLQITHMAMTPASTPVDTVQPTSYEASSNPINMKGASVSSATTTCAFHDGTPTPVATDKNCKLGVASLELDDAGCATAIAPVSSCSAPTLWEITKDDVSTDIVIGPGTDDASSCGSTISYPIHVSKSPSGQNYLAGTASLKIVNGGSCAAKISSVLFILEQSTLSYGGSAPLPPFSYGSGGMNSYQWAASGVEAHARTHGCDAQEVGPHATICQSEGSQTCGISVPYVDGAIVIDGAPLQLDTITVPAQGSCNTALGLNLDYLFRVDDTSFAKMVQYPSGYRITALVTFDSCCPRGAACGVSLNCDSTLNNIRTVQVRSAEFSIPTHCTGACDCVDVVESPDAFVSGNSPNPSCGAYIGEIEPESGIIGTTCASSTTYFNTYAPCCRTTDCNCAGTETYLATHANYVRVQSSSPGCLDPITGVSLLPPLDTAQSQYPCAYPEPVNCIVSEWSPVEVDTNCDDCLLTNTFKRTIVKGACHGGAPCPALEKTETTQCPPVCVLSDWSEWTSCAMGSQSRTKTILSSECSNNCAPSTQTQDCPAPPTPSPESPIDQCPTPQSCIAHDSSNSLQCVFGRCGNSDIQCTHPTECVNLGHCSATGGACRASADCPCPPVPCTYTRGGYHNCIAQSNPAQCARVAQDSGLFPLAVGYPSQLIPTNAIDASATETYLKWTTPATLLSTLVSGNDAKTVLPIGTQLVDSTAPLNGLQAQMVTAAINYLSQQYELYFKSSCSSAYVTEPYKTLFNGLSMGEILSYINAYNAGLTDCTINTLPKCVDILHNPSITVSVLNDFLTMYNEAFVDCKPAGHASSCFTAAPPLS